VRWTDIGRLGCSVARALSVVGDRWSLLLVRDAFLGVRRFEDFHRDLGMTRHRLADRLRKLVDAGILDRVPYSAHPPRFEYRLTEKGRDLHPIIVSLTRWGDRWMAGKAGPPLELVHKACGRTTMPALACPECGEPVGPRDLTARPGPGFRKRDERRGRRAPAEEASR